MTESGQEIMDRVLSVPSQALQAMRRIANGHAARGPLEELYESMFTKDPKEFSRQLHAAEKDWRAEAQRAKDRGLPNPGAPGGAGELLPDEPSERVEALIERILQEATGDDEAERSEGHAGRATHP